MKFPASNRILSICRSRFPQPTSAKDRTNKFNIIYAETSKAETPELQNKAALRAITAIRDNQPGGWDVWTDGSVTKTPLEWFHTISINERVAVLFTGGWYHGQIIPNANDDMSRRFI